MKKALKIVLALSIAAAAFGGGGKDSVSSSGPTVIELWYGAAVTEAGPPPADWVALKIIREKLNIDLRLTALPSSESDQDVKIQAAGAANSLPDIFQVRREAWTNLIEQGLIASVDDLYPLMPERTSVQYDKDSRNYTTIKGKSYGLASPGSVAGNEGVLIRKDWLDKLGLNVPVTIEDYLTVMRAFTFNDPDGNGKNDTYGYGAFIEISNYEEGLGRRLDPIMGAFGVAGTWNLSESNAGLNVRNPAYFEALSFVKKMIDERVLDPNWMSYGKDDFRAAWKQGRFGIMREQNAAYAAESNYAPFDKNFPKGEWIIIDPPMGPDGKQSVGVALKNYRIFAVSSKAEKAGKGPAIARLLEWMSSEEGYFLLGYGEKGINYNFDDQGLPTIAGLSNPEMSFSGPKGQVYTQLRNMVFYSSDDEMKTRLPAYTTAVSKKPMNAFAVQKEMQTKAWTPNNGADTLPTASADLKRFYEQGVLEFLTGKRQLTQADWNAWVADFDRLGGADWEKRGIETAKANNLLIK